MVIGMAYGRLDSEGCKHGLYDCDTTEILYRNTIVVFGCIEYNSVVLVARGYPIGLALSRPADAQHRRLGHRLGL